MSQYPHPKEEENNQERNTFQIQSNKTKENDLRVGSVHNSNHVHDAYVQARHIVETITEVISHIRSIDAFDPLKVLAKQQKQQQQRQHVSSSTSTSKDGSSISSTSTSTSTSTCSRITKDTLLSRNQEEEGKENVYVYHHFKEYNPNLISKIDQLTSSSSSCSSSETEDKNQYPRQPCHPLENDRYQLVHSIFIPLLTSLAETYSIIDTHVDDDDNGAKNANPTDERTDDENHPKTAKKGKRRKKQTPNAPKGLLSLTNYTDIASLLELTICTSILPLLESNILSTIQGRIQHSLPKSLQGRIRKQSLHWGMDVLEANKQWEQQQQQKQQKKKKQKQIQQKERLQNAIKKIRHAKRELSIVSNAISQIILLDRFRPMLLPRHVTDVYAVLFQLERLDDLEIKFRMSYLSLGVGAYEEEEEKAEETLKKGDLSSSISSDNDPQLNIQWIHQIFFLLHQRQSITSRNVNTTITNRTKLTQCQYHLMNNVQPIDIYTKVKSFQTLLLSGKKKTPSWLRTRVGSLLTDIAVTTTTVVDQNAAFSNSTDMHSTNEGISPSSTQHHNETIGLQSIIDVFVVAASSLPTEEMTGASSRLGQALCSAVCDETKTKKGSEYYYELLLNQCIKLLDQLVKKQQQENNGSGDGDGTNKNLDSVKHNNHDGEMNARTVGVILTIWAILEHLSKDVTMKFFFVPLVQGLFPTNTMDKKDHREKNVSQIIPTTSVQTSIGRILFLLMYTPPGNFTTDHVLNRFCQFLVSNSCLDFLKNEYEDKHKLSTTPSAPGVTSPFSQILRVACSEGNKVIECNDVKMATDTLKMIVYTVISKCKFFDCVRSKKNEGKENSQEMTIVTTLLQSVIMNPFDLMQYQFHRCAKSGTEGQIVFEVSNNDDNMEKYLITAMEERSRFIVHNILENTQIESNQFLPGEMFRLLLLVYFESNGGVGKNNSSLLPKSIGMKLDEYKIVSMMMLPLLCERCSPTSLFMDRGLGSNGVIQIVTLIISTISKQFGVEDNDDHISANEGDSETPLSIASIVLSLLVAMLELGSEKRSDKEEKDLKSMLPSLEALTILTPTGFQNSKHCHVDEVEKSKISVLKSEIAEMASHAMATIFARTAPEVENNQKTSTAEMSDADYINKIISDAEVQLLSEQPPLRARAVVQLRQLARGVLEEMKKSNEWKDKLKTKSSLIIELADNNAVVFNAEPNSIVKNMLQVCFKSLKDTESYVYLAGIQTIVSIADVFPSISMPILVDAITSVQIDLSPAQRIKITEALIFSIRRRGEAIRSYVDILMNRILYGKQHNSDNLSVFNDHNPSKIQSETDKYFRSRKDPEQKFDEYAIPSETEEDQQLRFNTGGPVFDTEETDVVRAAYISVVAELISTMHSASVRSYTYILVKLGLNALRLDHSRAVRRSAAFLCRELYSCALRELGDEFETPNSVNAAFTISLLKSDEKLLLTSLKRCISGDDVDRITSSGGSSSVKGKTRLYDPATVARCKEALNIRDVLSESGLLGLIELHINSNNEDTNPPFISQLLIEEQNEPISKKLLLDFSHT